MNYVQAWLQGTMLWSGSLWEKRQVLECSLLQLLCIFDIQDTYGCEFESSCTPCVGCNPHLRFDQFPCLFPPYTTVL